MMTVKLRYKQPDGDTSTLLEKPVTDGGAVFLSTSADFRFAAAVAAFGMVLRESPHKGDSNFDSVLEFAQGAIGTDAAGYRAEFVDLVRKAKAIASGRSVSEPRP
jgi:Ca-activated chloride channel family protein